MDLSNVQEVRINPAYGLSSSIILQLLGKLGKETKILNLPSCNYFNVECTNVLVQQCPNLGQFHCNFLSLREAVELGYFTGCI